MDAHHPNAQPADNQQIVTIFGGTGFIGRHVVRRLAKAGYTVKVATRFPESAYFLRPYGKVGQIVPFPCSYKDDAALAAAVRGAGAVINCVGILAENRRAKFSTVHGELPGRIGQAAASAGVQRLVHLSAIAPGKSRYADSKRAGEASVRVAFSGAVILRPSVVFGPEDQFFNRFARMAMMLPALPLIGGGTKMQPVYVGDVADAVMAAAQGESSGPRAATMAGETYELGGPEILTFREIYQRIFAATGRRPFVVPVPFLFAKGQGAVLQHLPGQLLTADQVETLKTDTVVAPGANTLASIGITATAIDPVVRDYLTPFRVGGVTPGRAAYEEGQP